MAVERRALDAQLSLALDRMRMICEFEAPDADSVRNAMRTAAVGFDKAWTADLYARD